MKGIRVEIYKWMGKDSSNRGVSSRKDTVTLLIPEGGYADAVAQDGTYLTIVRRYIGDYATPCNASGAPLQRPGMIGPMFGGTFIYSSDSRFREYCGKSPIPLHDRWETPEEYRALSA